MTSLHEVATERVPESCITVDLSRSFSKKPMVSVITDEVDDIDTKNYIIRCHKKSYAYDYLIVCVGCRPCFFGTPGAEENAFTLWSVEESVRLRDHMRDCFAKAGAETNAESRSRLLHFIITGAGFTGCELAGDMAEWFPSLCKEYGIDKSEPSITVIDMLSRPIPTLPEKSSDRIAARLNALGVKLMFSTRVKSLGSNSITIESDGAESVFYSSTLIWTAGIEGNTLIDRISDESMRKGRNRLHTDPKLRINRLYASFAAGDNLFCIESKTGLPSSQFAESAMQSGQAAARNILRCIDGRTDLLEDYNMADHGVMVTVGSRYCVANINLPGKLVWSPPSFLAMIAKHGVNCLFLLRTAGFWKVREYLRCEFFQTPRGRNFLSLHDPMKE